MSDLEKSEHLIRMRAGVLGQEKLVDPESRALWRIEIMEQTRSRTGVFFNVMGGMLMCAPLLFLLLLFLAASSKGALVQLVLAAGAAVIAPSCISSFLAGAFLFAVGQVLQYLKKIMIGIANQ